MSAELKKFIDGKVEGEKMSIVNLDGGGAIELIDTAIGDVLRNVADHNMKLKVKRQVIFKMEITPMDEHRSLVHVVYDVDAKLAKRIPISEGETFELKVDSTSGVYAKNRQRQEPLFDNVKSFSKGGK